MPVETEARRLAAILAADMVGFSRLIQLDEAGTLARQRAIHTELIGPRVEEFGGRVVKTTGDGALIEFTSSVNAVLCAVAVQREMAAREADAPADRRIAYRIGINLGDIIHDGDDIFGDGVNVASRLEGLAEPGGICVSAAVFNNVKGKLDLGFADLGPQKVKNLAEPIPTFRVLLDPGDAGKLIRSKRRRSPMLRTVAALAAALAVVLVGGYLAWNRFAPAAPGEPKLLVLPLRAETAASRPVADAATENLIASFARLKGLATAPYDLSMSYEGIAVEPSELPTSLDVRFILDGAAALRDDRLELAARLRDTRASGDGVIWEETREGSPEQWLEQLTALKRKAAGAMKLKLDPTERAILEARPTDSLDAYLAYAEAERFRHSGDFYELEQSLPLYRQAMALDPGFRAAQIGNAEANFTVWNRGYNTIRYTLDALAETELTIGQILEADETDPYAIGLQVRIDIERLNWDRALSKARAAVFRQPDEPWLRNILGQALLASGQYDEAREQFASYEAMSPRLNSAEKRDLAFQHLLLRDAKKALSLLESIPPEEAESIEQYSYMANAHARLGEIDEARAHMAKFLQETVWGNLAWQKGYFGIYADPALFEEWSAAMTAAGMPTSPFDFESGREADRLLHDDLMELYSDRYEEVHDLGPFGAPYREERNADGTMVMDFTWMKGQPFIARWAIKGDQFCHSTPAVHAGREECNNVYIDREKSTDDVRHIANVYSFGIFNSEFRRVAD